MTLKWVRHHWDLILWKLAAMARHQPEHAVVRWWCWPEVIRQLRYRYEREINRGQRSPLNRIKQHDSSAAQPMVLCVYKTEFGPAPPPPSLPDGSIVPGAPPEGEIILLPNVVLTDGWYTIRAHLDDTLYVALQRGKIHVGHKLQILGAKVRVTPPPPRCRTR